MPMRRRTPEEVREKLYSNNWHRREFAILQERFGDELLFEALYLVFCDPSPPGNPYEHQNFAGELLVNLNPSCPIPVVEFLRATLPHWNRSVEQLPVYVQLQFGREATVQAIAVLEGEAKDFENLSTKLSTCKYWLRVD
nr:hypothetical protein [uncultured bacterium]